jgi:hypothetical protein
MSTQNRIEFSAYPFQHKVFVIVGKWMKAIDEGIVAWMMQLPM